MILVFNTAIFSERPNSNAKINNNKNALGVTLIELLVVITIMMTMMSLVAPLAINTVNKAEAQTEFLSFCAKLRRASTIAFVNGKKIEVALRKNKLTVYSINSIVQPKESELIFEENYKYLTFSAIKLSFNKNGIANLHTITLRQNTKQKSLALNELLEG